MGSFLAGGKSRPFYQYKLLPLLKAELWTISFFANSVEWLSKINRSYAKSTDFRFYKKK